MGDQFTEESMPWTQGSAALLGAGTQGLHFSPVRSSHAACTLCTELALHEVIFLISKSGEHNQLIGPDKNFMEASLKIIILSLPFL